MKTREELKKEQERLLAVYEKVKDQLIDYPNVVNIGIGIKEKNGQLTGEGCIKIIVKEKKSEKDLDPSETIPKTVEGVPTDVIILKSKIPIAACTEDRSSHRPIKGGIMINNYRNGSGVGGSGTLGCLAKLVSDDSWVILSNHHVLYGEKGKDGDEIGQPAVGCSWCCKTNVIAENLDKDESLDCAIAKVKDDIGLENSIIEIGDLELLGSSTAVNGERVRKRGSRTGFTSGTISFIDPATKEITIDPNPSGGPADDPGGCTNYHPGTNVFAYHGDSGSVVVNDDNEVVGLLYSVSHDYSQGFASDIGLVKTAMNIKIEATILSPGKPISARSETLESMPQQVNKEDWIETIEEKLQETSAGRKIRETFLLHEQELFNLVNKHRAVAATWQRKQGPAFLAAFGRSVKHPGYEIPPEINRVSLQNLLMSMAAALEEHGSQLLRETIRKYAAGIVHAAGVCRTADDYLQTLGKLNDQIIPQLNAQ